MLIEIENIGGALMCLLDYNKEIKKYKHLTKVERSMIQRWINKDKKSNREIAELLGKSERTIRRERSRGRVVVKDYLWEDKIEYSEIVAQEKYEYNLKAKGQDLKLGNNLKKVKEIERLLKEEKKSPEVVKEELELNYSARTLRNYIKSGEIFNLTKDDMIYNKKYKTKNKEKRVSKMIPAEKSIEFRPEEGNDRSVYGHWEGDLIIGKRRKESVLLTLTERMTREEIIVKIPSKHAESVSKAFNKIERKLGAKFYKKFKTITFDNGIEFQNYNLIEKSCLRKQKRFEMYYAHPYCSGERGSNENNNRMIRRWIPKGTSIEEISEEFIKYVEDWLNNYLRPMFDYKSSNMVKLEI